MNSNIAIVTIGQAPRKDMADDILQLKKRLAYMLQSLVYSIYFLLLKLLHLHLAFRI